jgi:hypothetical protein
MSSKAISTYKYLRYVSGAAQRMTEVVADVEIEIHKRNLDIQNKTDPGTPPPMVGGMCFPPDRCLIMTDELVGYLNQLRGYVDTVFALTIEHVTAARERGVTEASFSAVTVPVPPTP